MSIDFIRNSVQMHYILLSHVLSVLNAESKKENKAVLRTQMKHNGEENAVV